MEDGEEGEGDGNSDAGVPAPADSLIRKQRASRTSQERQQVWLGLVAGLVVISHRDRRNESPQEGCE